MLYIAIWTMNKIVGVSMLVQYELGFVVKESFLWLGFKRPSTHWS